MRSRQCKRTFFLGSGGDQLNDLRKAGNGGGKNLVFFPGRLASWVAPNK
jgi:hypothetical protein